MLTRTLSDLYTHAFRNVVYTDGYLEEPNGLAMKRMLDAYGIPLLHHHTSGHAHPGDLRRLVDALAPELLVPIHTESPSMYESAFGAPTMGEGDGAWWTV